MSFEIAYNSSYTRPQDVATVSVALFTWSHDIIKGKEAKLYRKLEKCDQIHGSVSYRIQSSDDHSQKHFKLFGDMNLDKGMNPATCYNSAAFAKQNELKINYQYC